MAGKKRALIKLEYFSFFFYLVCNLQQSINPFMYTYINPLVIKSEREKEKDQEQVKNISVN